MVDYEDLRKGQGYPRLANCDSLCNHRNSGVKEGVRCCVIFCVRVHGRLHISRGR